MGYLGAKSGSGVFQTIINLIPPHDTYIEAFLGTGAVMKRKAPAQKNIGIDLNKKCIDEFDYAAASLICGDAFDYLRTHDFESSGRTVVYADPPYVPDTRTSSAKYDYELTNEDHIELLEILCSLPCYVLLSGYRGVTPNGTKTYYKDFLPMSMGALNAITMKIKIQYYKRSYWNILFRTKMKDARKNLIR